MHRHHIYIALCENNIPAFRFFCQIQGKKVPAFVENQGLGAVHVLRFPVAQDAPGEADHVSAHVDHREHEAVAEGIVKTAAVLAAAHKPRVEHLKIRVALGAHGLFQAVPGVRGKADAEIFRRGRADPPPLHIRAGALPGRGRELLIEKARGVPVERKQTAALAALLIVRLLRQLHPGALGQEFHRLGEGEVFDLHDEIDDAPALAAAEAVIDLLVRRDGEGGRFFAVEGAEAEQVGPALFGQAHIARDHVHNIAALGQFG